MINFAYAYFLYIHHQSVDVVFDTVNEMTLNYPKTKKKKKQINCDVFRCRLTIAERTLKSHADDDGGAGGNGEQKTAAAAAALAAGSADIIRLLGDDVDAFPRVLNI